jgi:hypothetical protein
LRTAAISDNPTFHGGPGGRVHQFDWDGNLLWDFLYSTEDHRLHHDIERLDNGNILMIAWERKTKEEAITAGRDTSLITDDELWQERIIEVEPAGFADANVIWEWEVWDHLVQDYDSTKANYGEVPKHPELIDLNYVFDGRADWLHMNAIDYNPKLDQIIASTPFLNEIWVIDHSTTTEEASGHTGGNGGMGGDILYRWGNPAAYRAGTAKDQTLFFQHDSQWIEAGLPGEGNILVFNNGRDRPDGAYSSIVELNPPVDSDGNYLHVLGLPYGPEQPQWVYPSDEKADFYSPFISGAQRLPNGNTLICSGANGVFFEIDLEGEVVWKYVNPVTDRGPIAQGDPVHLADGVNSNIVFRTYRYSGDYPGFTGKELTPGNPIELQNPSAVQIVGAHIPLRFELQQNYPNPFNGTTTIKFSLSRSRRTNLAIYNISGQEVAVLINNQTLNAGDHAKLFDATLLSSAVYLYRLKADDVISTRKMLLVK